MCASGRPITFLLLCLFGSATSSPVYSHTAAPPLPSQISPPSPSPSILPSVPSPSVSVPPSLLRLVNSGETTEEVGCPLRLSASTLAVRFGDPVTANCSVQRTGHSLLGWEVSLEDPEPTMGTFLVWSVDRMTKWDIKPTCFVLSDMGGPCQIHLPLIVYKPPDNVSISFVNHTGPLFEGVQYTLQCTVEDVAPVENLIVTFYGGQKKLGHPQSKNITEKKPVTEIFTLNITPSKEDDGVQYWCEARLDLGPEGPSHPPVVKSPNLNATVLFGPQLVCPTKLQVREGESLSCEVRGNPRPSVTWFRDGQVVALPTRSSRKHAGKYTVLAFGYLEQKNFTVEVEILPGSVRGMFLLCGHYKIQLDQRGTTNSSDRHFLLAVFLIQMINWL